MISKALEEHVRRISHCHTLSMFSEYQFLGFSFHHTHRVLTSKRFKSNPANQTYFSLYLGFKLLSNAIAWPILEGKH